jgi:alpha-tubulin suppressor-like RCC1 family protein
VAIRSDGALVAWGSLAAAANFPSRLTNALGVAAGSGFGLALSNAFPVLWGSSQFGVIYPVPPDLTNVVAVLRGPLVLRADGSVAGWYPYETVLSNAVAIATAGGTSLIGLRADGTVAAWGLDVCGVGLLNVPPGLTNVVGVAAGTCFCAALKADGTVVAWGDNSHGQTNVPPDLTNAVAIAAGAVHCLALRADGTVVEWGHNPDEQPWVTSGPTNFVSLLSNVVGIAAGAFSSLAVIGTGMPPRQVLVTNVAFGAGGFSAQVPTDRGKVYALEYKNSLADPQWQMLPLVAGTGGFVQLADKSATASQRFYRVRRW